MTILDKLKTTGTALGLAGLLLTSCKTTGTTKAKPAAKAQNQRDYALGVLGLDKTKIRANQRLRSNGNYTWAARDDAVVTNLATMYSGTAKVVADQNGFYILRRSAGGYSQAENPQALQDALWCADDSGKGKGRNDGVITRPEIEKCGRWTFWEMIRDQQTK